MINQLLLTIFLMMATEFNNPAPERKSVVMDEKRHKVIMQVTKADSIEQLAVISQVKNILKSLPNAQIEVVCHSQGLPLVVAAQSKAATHIGELTKQGIVFAACENTMERKKIGKEELLPAVVTVPSAMAEIILKQEAGWIYVKAGT